jgi:peptidoglycan/LPS O-acetylase OafA/YrhL
MDRGSDQSEFVLGYRPELDGLRGLAILAVMAYHSIPRCIPGGFLGVDVFFVLSGFLITVLLLQEHSKSGNIHLRRFYARRALRLFPALFVMLALCCAVATFRVNPLRIKGIYQAALLTVCYGANFDWLLNVPLDLFGHAWSLSLEEQFYLVWPLILGILLRFRVGLVGIGFVVVGGIFASAMLRAFLWACAGSFAAQIQAATTALPCRVDAIFAGCLVALLLVADRLPRSRRGRMILHGLSCASALLLICLLFTAESRSPVLYLGGFTVIAVAAAVCIAALMASTPRIATRFLGSAMLMHVGRLSYGLYLWHFPMLSLVPKLMHGALPITRRVPGLNEAASFAAAFAAATLSYVWVERPFLRWRMKLRNNAPKCESPPTSFSRHHNGVAVA